MGGTEGAAGRQAGRQGGSETSPGMEGAGGLRRADESPAVSAQRTDERGAWDGPGRRGEPGPNDGWAGVGGCLTAAGGKGLRVQEPAVGGGRSRSHGREGPPSPQRPYKS